jgi:hypothetical protein
MPIHHLQKWPFRATLANYTNNQVNERLPPLISNLDVVVVESALPPSVVAPMCSAGTPRPRPKLLPPSFASLQRGPCEVVLRLRIALPFGTRQQFERRII